MTTYTEKEIQEMEAEFDRLKKANLKTLKGPAKDRHKKRMKLLKAEIDAAKGNISSGRKTQSPSLQKDNNKSIVKLRSPAGDTPTSSRAYDPNNMVTYQTGFADSKRRKIRGENKMLTPEEKEAFRLRRAKAEKKANTRRDQITFPVEDSTQAPSRQRLEDNLLDVSENQGLGGTKPEDSEMNALEKLVSKIVGRNVRFEDIPEDDPFIADMPQNYQNLKRGGQVKRMGHGGAITPEQKKRMTRIAKEYKALRSKKKATAPKVATSKKRSAPFSDMKKAMMNGNKKRTNR